ncbi:MAG: HAMP domain-containing histidine kinase [Desulfarculus sp.]|nr:HAMP domain-containing histidine kinase [Desulfarculus sp.]
MNQEIQRDPAWLSKENQRLQALVDLGNLLADPVLDLERKLQHCTRELARLAAAESASIMLVEGQELVVRAATNQRIIGLATPLSDRTISTQVVSTGQPVHLTDVGKSDFAQVRREGDRSSYRTKSLISLPLLEEGQPVGVLNLSDKAGAAAFGQDDLTLAQSIASQLSRLINFSALHSRLGEAYQDLSRAQRAKDDLMYMIFHDMKAPVTGVKEVLKLLGPGHDLSPEERTQYLALAESDLELLWRRITNLLDLNRMDADQLPQNPTPLDLAALVRESLARLAAVARVRQVDLELKVESEPEVMADEDLVERILVNLVFNALKFSSPEEGGGGLVSLRVTAGGGQARVEVLDSGPGVDPQLGDEVFERYTQGRATRGSSGLGLYFCRRAARLLGGEVAFINLEQGGCCFSLTLPLCQEDCRL